MDVTILGTTTSPGLTYLSYDTPPPTFNPSSPSSSSTLPRRSLSGIDELAWTSRCLTWSRGAQVYRRYTYAHEAEDISCAAFVEFPVGLEHGAGGAGGAGTGEAKGKGADMLVGAAEAGRSRTFGPFHTGQHAVWGQAHDAFRCSMSTSTSSDARLDRALVVFLQTRAIIYLPSGDEVVAHIPFVVDSVSPLPAGGALVQRALEKRERVRLGLDGAWRASFLRNTDRSILDGLDEIDDGDMPRLYTLDRPHDELRMVVALSDDSPGPATSPVPTHHVVVFARAGLVILYDHSSRVFLFHKLVKSPHRLEPTKTARSIRPADRRPEKRSRLNLARAQTDRRISAAAAAAASDVGDRGLRRAPRLSKAKEGELLAAFEGRSPRASLHGTSLALVAEGSRRTSAGPSRSAGPSFLLEDEVGQFMREEAEVGPELRTGLGGGLGMGIGEKELRETTMLMGLERDDEGVRSDWVLQHQWSWRPDRPVDVEKLRIFITEEREPSRYHLNIHLADALFIFDVHEQAKRTVFAGPRAIACTAALPIISTRHSIHDTLIVTDAALRLLVGDHMIPITVPESRDDVARRLASSLSMAVEARERRVVGLEEAGETAAVAIFEDGERIAVDVDRRPRGVVRQCIEALAYLLPPEAWSTFAAELIGAPTWDALVTALRKATGLPAASPSSRERLRASAADPIARRLAARGARTTSPTTGSPTPCTAPALLALHLVAQDCRLSSTRQRDLTRLAPLLVELASALGRNDWRDYWLRLVPHIPPALGPLADATVLDTFQVPPDVLSYLSRRLVTRTIPFPSSRHYAPTTVYGRPGPCAQTDAVTVLYDLLAVHGQDGDIVARAARTVHTIVDRGLGRDWLADLPAGVAVPILEMVRIAQANPGKDWGREVYEFIGREDLAARCIGDQAIAWDTKQEMKEAVTTIRDIMAGTKARYEPGAYVRFGQDRRVQEVERIMQTDASRTIVVQDPPGANDQAVLQYHQNVVNTIANRTLAITVGQGIFEYGTRTATITDPWPIPLIELAVKITPGSAVVKAQLATDGAEWPCFHNGVARALAISPDACGIDSAWLVFNRPVQLNPEHGGFLLGLGLAGHLRPIKTYHAFGYLEPRHETTSVGLLLGLAASFAGSQDVVVTKVLSLHTRALLPHGSMDLQAQPMVQAVALLGIGLVYAGSRVLRTAEVALGEIGRKELEGVDGFAQHAEAYSFSASMALGLVMLGRGGSSEADKRIADELVRRVFGGDDVDTTITASGAALALGLMYLRTNRADVAATLMIPQNAVALDNVRPDLLLILTFARALIMWDAVKPSQAWLDAELPPFVRAAITHKRAAVDLTTELAYFNIIAGACLAIGIKYAGTASEAAHNCLITFFGVLGKAAAGQSMAYEGRIRRHGARQALNIVTIALAAVMSGTGELNVLRRLRVSHGQEGAGVTYGSHMAMHMALGLLFLGRGYYTLGDSDLAVAAMAIAFFPRFLGQSSDNKAYPQAFRHLWALAAEPRCLVARDVETRETVYLPVRLRTARARGETNLISPTLVAPFDTLHALAVDSPRYWPVRYDFASRADRASLVRTRTVWVKRRAAYADYNVDPRGNRSVFVRAGAMTGLDTHHDLVSASAPPQQLDPDDVARLVKQHTADPSTQALAAWFRGSAGLDAFVRTVVLECLSLDKPALVGTYLQLYLGMLADRRADGADGLAMDRLANVRMVRHFLGCTGYAPPAGGDKRFPLVRLSFVSALAAAKPVDARATLRAAKAAYLATGQWDDPATLARWLADGAPSVQALDALRDLVRRAPRDQTDAVKLKVRDVVRAYEAGIERVWDAEPGAPAGARVWNGADVREAVEVWMA
ncbi:Anaphase-promoting complex subunit 1 [Cryptotrichosporon argae]